MLSLSPVSASIQDTSEENYQPVFAALPFGWDLHSLNTEKSGVWVESAGDRYLIVETDLVTQSFQMSSFPSTVFALSFTHFGFIVMQSCLIQLTFAPLFCRLRDGPLTATSPRGPPNVILNFNL